MVEGQQDASAADCFGGNEAMTDDPKSIALDEIRRHSFPRELYDLGVSESFADAPISLGERRAERNNDAELISPRETLIKVLRRIDAGELIEIDTLVVCILHVADDGKERVSDFMSGASTVKANGLLTYVANRRIEDPK